MRNYQRLIIWIGVAFLLHLSVYLYLDQVLLAPTSAFQVSAAAASQLIATGEAYYSHDHRYMANVTDEAVKIYSMPGQKLIRTIALGEEKVSYFKWLEDRDLALMALHANDRRTRTSRTILTHVNPLREGNELTATVKNLPANSKITDVAFSTATNVIYMQTLVGTNPDTYRIYREDANHELTRIYLTGNHIGRIAALYHQDCLIYDNLDKGIVYARYMDGSWRVISPSIGRYRLIGVDADGNIFIAKLNKDDLGESVLYGGLKKGFTEYRKLPTPTDIATVKLADIMETDQG